MRRVPSSRSRGGPVSFRLDPGGVGRRDHVPRSGSPHRPRGHDRAEERHLPHLGTGLVVAHPLASGDARKRTLVGVAEEVDRSGVLPRLVVERDVTPGRRPGGVVRGADGRLPLPRVSRGDLEQAGQEDPRRADPLRVRPPAVRLYEEADPVAPAPVGVRHQGSCGPGGDAGGGLVVLSEGRVEAHGQVPGPGEPLEQLVAQAERSRAQGAPRDVGGHDERDVVPELGPVGHVKVHVDDRVPRVEEGEEGLRLGRFGLREVAVQVQVLGRRAPAAVPRTPLLGPLAGAKALVTVDVEHGDEDERGARQPLAAGAPCERLAHHLEPSVLAVDLARVDAALEDDGRPALGTRRHGVEDAVGRGDERHHGPPLGTGPEPVATRAPGVRGLEGIAEGDGLRVATGRVVSGRFRRRAEGLVRLRRR